MYLIAVFALDFDSEVISVENEFEKGEAWRSCDLVVM